MVRAATPLEFCESDSGSAERTERHILGQALCAQLGPRVFFPRARARRVGGIVSYQSKDGIN